MTSITLASPPGEARAVGKGPRRSQTERREQSIKLIVEATVRCLFRTGYGATTIDAILKESGASRGRLLHLFPTKVDIMIAVSRRSWEQSRQTFSAWYDSTPDPRDRRQGLVEMLWQAMSRPAGIAVLEILMASRSDAELARRFVPAHRQIQREAIASIAKRYIDMGWREDYDFDALHRYVEATIRGLCIDRAFGQGDAEYPASLNLLKLSVDAVFERNSA